MKTTTVLRLMLTHAIYILSFLFIRNSRKWIFSSASGFSENAKYLYLDILKNHNDIQPVWISGSLKEKNTIAKLGYKSYYKFEVAGLWHLFTAKVYFGTHGLGLPAPAYTLGTGIYVELWHGIPIKKIGYLDDKFGLAKEKESFLFPIKKFFLKFSSKYSKKNILIVTSQNILLYFSKIFNLNNTVFIESYLPRSKHFVKYKKKPNEKLIYLYLPTFRDKEPDFLNSSKFNFNSLNSVMCEIGGNFLIKPHPQSNNISKSKLKNLENIKVIESDSDIYSLLPQVDVIITDYSSVYIDAMLLKDIALIFFPFDIEKYTNDSRGLAFNYTDVTPGIHVHSFQELCNAIKFKTYEKYQKEKFNELHTFFWGQEEKKDIATTIKNILCVKQNKS